MENENYASTIESKVPQSTTSLQEFTERFFCVFGSMVETKALSTEQNAHHLLVKLPVDLVELFGKSELSLAFRPQDMQAGTELVATGSRVFDRMMNHLEGRSALTLQGLPQRFAAGEELLRAVQPLNASIVKLNMQEQEQNLYCFNWHITYRADDKNEELYTVVLDESGTRIPIIESIPGANDPKVSNLGEDRAVEISGNSAENPSRRIALDALLTDAEPLAVEQNADGQPLPPKLPPMTQLVRLADSARKYAIYHADVRCVDIEAEIQPRLYKVLSRLHTYYSQQIEEVYDSHDPTGEKRVVLESDLGRKLAEEVENHRLRVQVRLLGYAILKVPVAIADLHLNDGKHDVNVRVRRNRYTGALRRPECHACGTETTAVAIDRSGHITCNDCLQQCATCMDLLCKSCEVLACPVCTQENCDTCGKICWACGERGCTEHVSDCPTCYDAVCHSCQTACAECGTAQCRTHLRADSVLDEEGTNSLICSECAVHCPGCQQYSTQIGLCENSGQRYCKNCLAKCSDCGKEVGPEYTHISPTDQLEYCHDCLKTCLSCQSPTSIYLVCRVCNSNCCAKCSSQCAECDEPCCSDHAVTDLACGHTLCTDHAGTCAIGGEHLCSTCSEACGICERNYCAVHTETCLLCRCAYCVECVRNTTGLCDTCSSFEHADIDVYLAEEPIATHKDVAPLVDRYRWFRAENALYTIYLGRGSFNTGAFVLLRKGFGGGQLLVVRKLPVLDQLWRRH